MNTALILNLLVIVFEIIGLYISIRTRKWKILYFYTQLSNLTALVSSVLYVFSAGSPASVLLRYLSTVMLIMTFMITLFVLVPMGGGFRTLMISGNGLYHHTLCPLISAASYIFLEPHGGHWLIPTLVTLAYGLIMLYLNWKRLYDGPYPFFRVHNQSVTASVLWTLALFAIISVFSLTVSYIAP